MNAKKISSIVPTTTLWEHRNKLQELTNPSEMEAFALKGIEAEIVERGMVNQLVNTVPYTWEKDDTLNKYRRYQQEEAIAS